MEAGEHWEIAQEALEKMQKGTAKGPMPDDEHAKLQQEFDLHSNQHTAKMKEAEAIDGGTGNGGRNYKPPHARVSGMFGGNHNAPADVVLEDGQKLSLLSKEDKLGNGDYAAIGDVIRGVATGNWGTVDMSASVQGGSNSGGGYMLAPTVANNLIDLARARSVTSDAGVRTLDMPSGDLRLVKLESDPTLGWVAESGEFTQDSPTFGSINMRARKMGVIVRVSREILEDSANASSFIDQILAEAAAAELDRVVLEGSGAGEEPKGILNHADILEEDVSGGIDWDNFITAHRKIRDKNGEPGAIIMPPTVAETLASLKINSEDNHYAMAPAGVGDLPRFVTSKLGTDKAVLGDFSQVVVGIRSGIEVVASELASGDNNSGFGRDEVLIRLRWRGDVAVLRPTHIAQLTNIS